MTLARFVSQLTARLAFVAALLFGLGSWPAAVLASSLASGALGASGTSSAPSSDTGTQLSCDETEDDEVALHRQGPHDERKAEQRARPRGEGWGAPRVARAVPFAPAQQVTRAPPRLPYRPLLRLLC